MRPAPIDIERATYISWPAFEQVDYRGWVLRFAEGCTKRANSVNAISPPVDGTLRETVAYCEAFYQTRQLPAIFRLLSFVDDPTLDCHLAGAGYDFIDPSLVLCQELGAASDSTQRAIGTDRARWLDAYDEISGPTR